MRKLLQKHIISILLIALSSVLSAVAATMLVLSDTSFYDDYSYIRFVDNRDSIVLTDEDFYDNCAKVVFPVNKFGLPKNDKTLEELEKVVLPRVNADSLELVAIVIRGAASPEGPYLNNKMLSRRRAKALTDFVTSRMIFKGDADSVSGKGVDLPKAISQDYDIEDYRSLCIAMKKAADPDYEYVQGLCDKYLETDVHRLKRVLMNARQGQLWKRLLRTYYPQLRSARIMLFFRKYHPQPEPIVEPEPADTLPADTLTPDTAVVVVPDTIVSGAQYDEKLVRRKMLAVKTNLLFDFAYMPGYDRWCPIPNVALEYYPQKGHFTYGFSFDMPWWQHYNEHKYFQLRNYQLESRWYWNGANVAYGANGTNGTHEPNGANEANGPAKAFNKQAFTGLFVKAYVHTGLFGICFDENRGWVGEGFGAGVGAGYVVPLTRSGHWKLELGMQLGFFTCKYDPYQYENPVNPAFRDHLYYYKWTQKPSLFKKRQYRWSWIGPTRVDITLSYDLLYRRIQKKGVSLKGKERYRANGHQGERRNHE